MDNFGSEISQKMRSAVKAKLIELGTGGGAGYIDDELPDYVMIMVANKRSKQQMISDLNLFLGDQTDLFVTWLHEVLQKLQEVTIPATTAKKRKANQKEEVPVKRDKRFSRRDKRNFSKSNNDEIAASSTENQSNEKPTTTAGSVATTPAINSLPDMFAVELLEKAKKTINANENAAASIKKGKPKHGENGQSPPSKSNKTTNEFDIPTMSEISSTTDIGNKLSPSVQREKTAELAELQRKIYAAKKHLKETGELSDNAASEEDEDCLNLRLEVDADDFVDSNDAVKTTIQPSDSRKERSPIVYDYNRKDKPESATASSTKKVATKETDFKSLTPPPLSAVSMRNKNEMRKAPPTNNVPPNRSSRERDRRDTIKEDDASKRPIYQRLGARRELQNTNSRERTRPQRSDKQLYVPSHLRKEMEREKTSGRNVKNPFKDSVNQQENLKQNVRQAAVSRERSLSNGEKSRSKVNYADRNHSDDHQMSTSPEPTQRQRIGSRIFVAPVKSPVQSDDGSLDDKSVNSIIKVKPRPQVSPSKQASKNLLMRAVAEAQRSTIQSTKKPKEVLAAKVEKRVEQFVKGRNTKLFTKSYRDRIQLTTILSPKSRLRSKGGNSFMYELESNLKGAQFRTKPRQLAEIDSTLQDEEEEEEEEVERYMALNMNFGEEGEEEYVPPIVSGRSDSDVEYIYVAQSIERKHRQQEHSDDEANYEEFDEATNTQFVVTMNEDKAPAKYRKNSRKLSAHNVSPLPQVSSTSSTTQNKRAEASSSISKTRRRLRASQTSDIRSHLATKTAITHAKRNQTDSTGGNTPPTTTNQSERTQLYQKPKEVNKFIIKTITDDELSSLKPKIDSNKQRMTAKFDLLEKLIEKEEKRSTTPPLPNKVKEENTILEVTAKSTVGSLTPKTKRTPITFDIYDKEKNGKDVKIVKRSFEKDYNSLKSENKGNKQSLKSSEREKERDWERDRYRDEEYERERERDRDRERERERERERARERDQAREKKKDRPRTRSRTRSRSRSRTRSIERHGADERRRISIRTAEVKKYDNIPALSNVPLDSNSFKPLKTKERCKYHPNCTKHFCEFYHPVLTPCKSFPNCKFADKCMYTHPKCKFDLACTNAECNYAHSGQRNLPLVAPPLSSHVVPVQNYKSISVAPAASSAMCKYFPNCSKTGCTFYHPKMCRFGKNCINKLECNFYHHDVQSSNKFKWVATVV